MIFSGSHRQSLRELQQENADIAAIDWRDLRVAAAPSAAGSGWPGGDRLIPAAPGLAADHRRRHPGGDAE